MVVGRFVISEMAMNAASHVSKITATSAYQIRQNVLETCSLHCQHAAYQLTVAMRLLCAAQEQSSQLIELVPALSGSKCLRGV